MYDCRAGSRRKRFVYILVEQFWIYPNPRFLLITTIFQRLSRSTVTSVLTLGCLFLIFLGTVMLPLLKSCLLNERGVILSDWLLLYVHEEAKAES